MNVEQLTGRPHAVGRIDVATMCLVVFHAPVVVILGPIGFEAMQVASLDVHQFTEDTVLRHIERCHLEEVIDAVFEHHAMELGAFCHVDHVPNLLHRQGCGHFASHVLAVLHGIEHHGSVVNPVGANVYKIDVRTFTNSLPGILAACISICFRHACCTQETLTRVGTLLMQVAERLDFHTGEIGVAIDGILSSHAEADEADTNGIDGWETQPKHVFLSGRTSWCFHGDDAAHT